MLLEQIISLVTAGASLVFLIIAIILRCVKHKGLSQKDVEELSKMTEVIGTIVPNAVAFAEQDGLTGSLKKLVALAQVQTECKKIGVDYDEHLTQIDEALEKNVEVSKQVNVRDSRRNIIR